MKTIISVSLLLVLIQTGLCGETTKRVAPIKVIKNELDKSLKKGEALFEFSFINTANQPVNQAISASVNGKQITINPDKNGKYSFKCSEGKYKFQFYIPRHWEVYSDSIIIKDRYKQELEVTFEQADMEIIADKPVIYLYPETEKEISLKLEPDAGFKFTYPQYNNGWDVTASPDGTIKQDNRTYPYLFWEGNWNLNQGDIDPDEGFVVDKANLVKFLETKLYAFGLNDKEVTDFITYWAPRMNTNNKNFIRFYFNEEYNKVASLTVDPKPESSLRIFMVWMNADEMKSQLPKAQVIPQMQRKGFTLVEWGGSEVKTINN